jgi:hypothetical protein
MTYQPFPLPRIRKLPRSLPDEGAISMMLEEGIPIFRASRMVQERIQLLLDKVADDGLSSGESEELDRYEEIDDYLSHLNRLIRNSILSQTP